MRKILASVDIGSSTIKLVVGEIQKSNLNVLACCEVPSHGIKNGYIVNPESASLAFKELFKKGETLLGLPIKQVLVCIPSYGTECFLSEGSITITSEDKVVSNDDMVKAMQKSVYNEELNGHELVSILPTKFVINDEETIKNPIGSIANKLTVHDVVVTAPSKNSAGIIKCIEELDVKVIDVCISPLSDFYEFKTDDMLSTVGAIVNIGYNNTTVSIFNKGILIKNAVLDMGSDVIDKDIAYIFKVSRKDACYLKERLAVTDIDKADPKENLNVKDGYCCIPSTEDFELQVNYEEGKPTQLVVLPYFKPSTNWPEKSISGLVDRMLATGTVPATRDITSIPSEVSN